MTKHVLVLFSHEAPPRGGRSYRDHVPALQAAHDTEQVIYHFGLLTQLRWIYSGGNDLRIIEPQTGWDVSQFDLVFFQLWHRAKQHALAVADYLDYKGTDFFPRAVVHQYIEYKLAECVRLVLRGSVPYPRTIVAPLADYEVLFEGDKVPFGYPFVLKSISATRGNNNFLIRTVAQLRNVVQTADPDLTFMAQEYIACDSDYRLAIIGGEVAYVLRRRGSGQTHLHNTSQGGNAAFVALDKLPDQVVQDAIQAATVTQRQDFAGVDVLFDDAGQHYILEVNPAPEIQTGSNAPYKTKLLADYIARRIGD